ncbi:MAG: NAD(+) kinase [Gammaproteobacteria bacterium]
MTQNFNRIAVLGKFADPRVSDCVTHLLPHLQHRGTEILLHRDTRIDHRDVDVQFHDDETLFRAADLIITVGGDGTMLDATRRAAGHGPPLLGINRGRLGFLADISPDDMLDRLDEILDGHYEKEDRLLLHARKYGSEGAAESGLALNDIALQRWDTGRMLDFETWINGRYVNTHGGDGLVIATPTGSTAYALSCGGPIIQPGVEAVVLAPICPHTLSDRPLVVGVDVEISLRVLPRPETNGQVGCDGQLLCELLPGDELRVRIAEQRVTLLHPEGYDYYRILRSKLHWGRGSFDRGSHG